MKIISQMEISIWLIIFRQTAKRNQMKSSKSGIPISLLAGQDVHGLRPEQENHVPLTNCRPAPISEPSFQPYFNKMLGPPHTPPPPPPPPHTHTVGCDVLTYVVHSKSTAGRSHFRAWLDSGAACCRHDMTISQARGCVRVRMGGGAEKVLTVRLATVSLYPRRHLAPPPARQSQSVTPSLAPRVHRLSMGGWHLADPTGVV